MKKTSRILVIAMAIMMVFGSVAFAAEGDARTAIGANLSDSQKATVYGYFGIEQGSVPELTVTIDEEKAYLGGKVDAEKIGSRSLSSVYVKEMGEDYGITVQTYNINWVTNEMYISALATAGVQNAQIIVAAPVSVSGTAALTGLFKCYEDVTGEKLDEDAKDTAGDELIITGDLQEVLESDEAVAFMNELKKALAETENMTDEELRQMIIDTAKEFNVALSDEQINSIISWLRKLAKLDLDTDKLLEQAQGIADTLNKLEQAQEKTSGFFNAVSNAWNSVVNWFKNLFGAKE